MEPKQAKNPAASRPVNGSGPAGASDLCEQLARFGARDIETCMQCGNCSASCPLSQGSDTFPRKIYRYLQLGLKDKLLASPVPWLCYYCGECNKDCPRGAEPAETMMAARRWLTTEYDRTGLAKKLYLSEAWEIGALSVLALGIILLFALFHGPVITDRVAVNTFAPVLWVEIGDLAMAAVLSAFLLTNAFRMYRLIMAGQTIPFTLYITEAWRFVVHFATQKRWRNCGEDKTRWLKHFILVTGYMTMMTLIIGCIRWFQVDDSTWHFTSIFGYYATAALLYITADMFLSRLKKKADIHRFSQPTDWLFLVLLFLTTLTGILMHLVRLAGWPLPTYIMYVIHLAIAVPMLVIEVPFGKWSHLFYRPLAIYLTRVREKADKKSLTDPKALETALKAEAKETFLSCIQCGTCTSVCPWNRETSTLPPRTMLRRMSLNSGTFGSIDRAAWTCLTCQACTTQCPRGIDPSGILAWIRKNGLAVGAAPAHAQEVLESLKVLDNPWQGQPAKRLDWAAGTGLPDYQPDMDFCLFTCCTTAFGPETQRQTGAGASLVKVLETAGKRLGTLGPEQACCGDPAALLGDAALFQALREKNCRTFSRHQVNAVLTTSPHCYHTLDQRYPGLKDPHSPVRVTHHILVLDKLLAQGRLKLTHQIDAVATYHDPCYLGRHSGIYDEPRRILSAIPGLTLVEMASNREKALCCGGGGGNAWAGQSTALGIARIEEALLAGADIIAAPCPFCMAMLTRAARAMGVSDRIRVRDPAELLDKALGTDHRQGNGQDRKHQTLDQEEHHG